MSRFSDQPEPLSELLNTVARRVKKVDLSIIERIRELWPTLVHDAVATRCQPEFVKNHVLVISVPSGAFAQQITLEQESILQGLAGLGDRAPTALRTVQKP
jgi:predicted nucleic acid-binding Zn ribbon protein